MKLISWNVRGLGNTGSKNALRQLITLEKPDAVFISETKLSVDDFERFCRSCGYGNVLAHNSNGASGGVGLCWNNSVNLNLISYDFWYIDVEVLDDGDGNRWRLTGFYGNPEVHLRHTSWSLLRNLSTQSNLPWLCIGDFNEILYSYEEKKGGRNRNRGQMLAFQRTVTDTGLIDLGYHGPWYTWSRGGVNSPLIRCRLDRALATNEWWELIPNFRLTNMVNSHSDHSPICLTTGSSNNDSDSVGLPPKRLCASWVHDPESEEIVRTSWSNSSGSIPTKLRTTLDALARWSAVKFKGRKKKKKKLQKKLDRLALLKPDDAVLEEMLETKTALNFEINQEEALWAQRAHINWLREGDQNTSFFHKSAKQRRRFNTVKKLLNQAGNVEHTTTGMIRIATDYFKELFTTSNPGSVDEILVGIERKIDSNMNAKLCCEYTGEEVRSALFSMGPDRASGPDGMTARFYQKFWPIVGGEVTRFCLEFLNGDRTLDDINDTNIILLPKKTNPEDMRHFRPISLSNVLYKIIAKTLANRFKGILDVCIDPAQSAFIPGRLISDNVLIAYELLHKLKNSRSGSDGRFALKMDMSKAYDRVEWNYLEAVMLKMGFADGFVAKVMHCVRTVSYSGILNGTVSDVFRPTRGIRQGDPLSTYLFLICSEGLSSLLRSAHSAGTITGLQASSNGPVLTHLLFADDAIIFGDADTDGATKLRDIILTYGRCSGQQVNYDKSLIFFSPNTSQAKRSSVKSVLRVRVENNPEKYLGLPSMVGKNRTASFQYLRDRMSSKVQNWTTRFLSQGGKEVFIKSILQSLPTYAMGCFLLPKGLCNKMNSVMSKYWWRGSDDKSRIYWAKWAKVCTPKVRGGLGFRDLGSFNIAMLAKQGWRLLTNTDSLVFKVLKAKYFPNTSFLEARLGNSPSLTWRSIWSARGLLEKGLCWRIGNGISVRTWFEQWVPGLPPHRLTPIIDRLNPIGRVAEYIDFHTMSWKESMLRTVVCESDVEKILCIQLPRIPMPDVIAWQFNTTGVYSVSSGYKVLTNCHPSHVTEESEEEQEHSSFYRKLWQIKLPPKIFHHIWKVFKNYTSTNLTLYNKYVGNSPYCPRCSTEIETSLHTFRDCSTFTNVWEMLNIHWGPADANETVQKWLCNILRSTDAHKVRTILIVIWATWTNRNKLIHEGTNTTVHQLKFFVDFYLRELDAANAPRTLPRHSGTVSQRWVPPTSPLLKANFDAGYDKETKTGYAGVVIRNSMGIVKAAAGFVNDRINSPCEAEATACLFAMQMAFSLSYKSMIFEGDSRVVVKYLNEDGINRSDIAPVIHACKQWMSEFEACDFNWSGRNTNRCAHTLAADRRRWETDRLWIDEVPVVIKTLIEEEMLIL